MRITHSRFEARFRLKRKKLIRQPLVGVVGLRLGVNQTAIEGQMAEIQVAEKSGLRER